jgi:MATE family multidrug resistance protein
MNIENKIELREKTSGGIYEVLKVAFPLILSASGHAIRIFSDRVMLSKYSADALSASLTAGLWNFMLLSFFLGVVGYTNTFVAQYMGAKREERVGPSVWQGIYLAMFGGVVISAFSLFSREIFAFGGHAPSVQAEQVRYFNILTSFSPFHLMAMGVLSFWSGRGKTWACMAIDMSAALLNVVLNYILIFGNFGFEEHGIVGAGFATGISSVFSFSLALTFFLRPSNRERFNTLPKITLQKDLLKRMVRFGLPNGVHFFLDIAAFNFFVTILGRTGRVELEASAIAFAMNALAFIPMVGLGIAVSILVGQSVGAKDISHAKRSVRSARKIMLFYMAGIALFFVVSPETIVALFERSGDHSQVETRLMAMKFLRFIAAFLLFDGFFILYNNAIKGAGDTKWAMITGIIMAWGAFAVPSYLIYKYTSNVWYLWTLMVFYIALSGFMFYRRYRKGKWKFMSVIESEDSAT